MFDARILGGIGVLVAVVEAGSFVGAAKVLAMTQSGVSRAIARLETRVGVRLLQRTPRAVVLTEEGRRFHEEVVPHLEGIEGAALAAASTVGLRAAASASPSTGSSRGSSSDRASTSFSHAIRTSRWSSSSATGTAIS